MAQLTSEDSMHRGDVLVRAQGHSVIDCECCGFRHVLPLPKPEDLRRFYEEEFYQSEKADYLTAADEDFEWKRVEMIRRFHVVEGLLGLGCGVQGEDVAALDIGSGPGDFLMVAKERGWKQKGIEPSPVASEYARSRGLDVDTGLFSAETAKTLGSFSFIHMSEVLEHVADPAGLLQQAVNLLRPGGVICVSVPNDFSGIQAAAVASADLSPWWVQPTHHLNYFDFNSLQALLGRSGLEVVKRTTNFPMELFLLMGKNYVGEPELGKELHGLRKTLDISLFERNPQLLETFYEKLAEAGLGRLAIVFARKPR